MTLRNLSRVDLNLLHVFVAIYQEASVTRAAEVLNLSQPAVSNSIGRLRDIFGDPLFVRSAQGVAPTPLAHRLIVPVRDALSTLERAFAEHEEFDPIASDRIMCFSMSDFAEAVLLAPLAGEISRMGSRIRLQNHFTAERGLSSRLASGELDFAIESHPLDEPKLERLLLMDDEFVCVVRRGHPAARELSIEAYLGLDHLHISNRPRVSNLVDGALAELKCRRRISVKLEHCLGAGAILLESDLCLTIPRAFVTRFLPDETFTILPRPFEMPPLRTWLYRHPASERSPAHRWVRALLAKGADARRHHSP